MNNREIYTKLHSIQIEIDELESRLNNYINWLNHTKAHRKENLQSPQFIPVTFLNKEVKVNYDETIKFITNLIEMYENQLKLKREEFNSQNLV